MQLAMLTLMMTLSTQQPLEAKIDTVPAPVGGAALGVLGGAVVVGGSMLAFSATCVSTSQSCPWGDDGGAMIGALAMVPAATIFGALVGGVSGAVIAARLEHEEHEAVRVAASERQQRERSTLQALRTLPSPAIMTVPAPAPPPHPEAAARAPDDVDVDVDG